MSTNAGKMTQRKRAIRVKDDAELGLTIELRIRLINSVAYLIVTDYNVYFQKLAVSKNKR